MSHFAKVENGIVTQVIVIEQDVLNTSLWGDPASWLQTSYNTRGGVHYGADNQPDGGVALRGNFAGIGYIYDKENDVFYAPQPYPSWILNKNIWGWEAPVAKPFDDKPYVWNEETKSWDIVVPPASADTTVVSN